MKPMTITKLIALVLAPAAVLVFTGCKTHTKPSPFTDPNTSYKEGVAGGVVVDTYYDLSARVTAIDAVKRTVTVIGANDYTTTFICGPEVRNFDQIRIGDKVEVRLLEQLSAAEADPKTLSPDGTTTTLLLAPKGAMPGAAVAETTQVTATLTGIDTLRHIASFRFPDGSLHHYAIRPDVKLTTRQYGEKIVIRKTMATAISVKRP